MSEVHRYNVVTMLSAAGATIGYDPHGPEVVMASDFDEATRLFLDAAERCLASERREKELQQRLAAADERADVLEGLLRKAPRGVPGFAEWEQKSVAALKQAEGGGDEPFCTICCGKKTVRMPAAKFVRDCPRCCHEEG